MTNYESLLGSVLSVPASQAELHSLQTGAASSPSPARRSLLTVQVRPVLCPSACLNMTAFQSTLWCGHLCVTCGMVISVMFVLGWLCGTDFWANRAAVSWTAASMHCSVPAARYVWMMLYHLRCCCRHSQSFLAQSNCSKLLCARVQLTTPMHARQTNTVKPDGCNKCAHALTLIWLAMHRTIQNSCVWSVLV